MPECPYSRGLRGLAELGGQGVHLSVKSEMAYLRKLFENGQHEKILFLRNHDSEEGHSGESDPGNHLHLRVRALIAICIEDVWPAIDEYRHQLKITTEANSSSKDDALLEVLRSILAIATRAIYWNSNGHFNEVFYYCTTTLKDVHSSLTGAKRESVEDDILQGIEAGLLVIRTVFSVIFSLHEALPEDQRDEQFLTATFTPDNLYAIFAVWAGGMGYKINPFEGYLDSQKSRGSLGYCLI